MQEVFNDNAEDHAAQGGCNGNSHVVVVIYDDTTTPLISKVHGRVRNTDHGSYDPMVVSLGPYHSGRDDLLQMEKEKAHCRQELCNLTGKSEFDYLHQVIAPLRQQARMYYLHGINDLRRGRNERDIMVNFRFNRMLLQDAAFLLVTMKALDTLHGHNGAAQREQRTHGRWMDVAIVHDLLLLENQIPFIVVEKLYQVATAGAHDDDCEPFSRVMEDFARSIIRKHANSVSSTHQNGRTVHHLLHQCHMLLEPTKPPVIGETSRGDEDEAYDATVVMLQRRWHRAVQYHVAGVGLTKRIFDGGVKHHRLLDVEYHGGALEIPVLHVYDNTCSMFRNLMAMEQATASVGHYVTAYCVFLSRLMCTAEDVALLTKKGILVHHLGSDEMVAALFADLCKNVVFNDDDEKCNYLRAACVAADERYQSRVRNWMTWLKHKHFRNPWLAMGAVAAVLVTICTVVQAVFAVFPSN